jgi:PAS domain S-box-containing protein
LKGAQIAPPDLILLDINMPIMNGYEVCEQLKIRPETGEIPVIFISALDQVRDKIKAFQIGGVDYITKPFHVEEVLARVENQLKQQRLSKQLQEQNTRLTAEITVRQRAEEEIFFLVSTTQAIAEASDFHSALSIILRSCCQTINWDFGEAWVPRADGTSLERSQAWYASSPDLEEFRQHSLTISKVPLAGLAQRIWSSKQPEWIEDVSVEPEDIFTRSHLAATVGLKASFGVPILLNDQVLAILVFLKKTASPIQPHLVELVNAVATQLGSLIQRKQTEDALQIAEEKYHSIVENAVEGIFQSSPDGRFLSANLALAKIYGYNSPEELIESIEDISGQIYVDSNCRQEFLALIESENEVKEFESLVYRKDNKVIWISENTRAVRDSQARLLYYEGTVSDITERKSIQEALKFQQEKTETLLLNILPAPIAKQLQQNQSPIADRFEEVSVLFADIVGFTEFSNRKTPEDLVSVLNIIFSTFDQLAQQYGLEKIKTIGDAYMVVGGLPTPRSDHAQAIAQMALSIQAVMADINAKIGEAFTIRIGINIGPVVAGVIGLSKFIYDLWGDTVNIASRMELTGIPGKTQVTSATYERLKEQFLFEERGQVSIKGKGDMTTYFLFGRK